MVLFKSKNNRCKRIVAILLIFTMLNSIIYGWNFGMLEVHAVGLVNGGNNGVITFGTLSTLELKSSTSVAGGQINVIDNLGSGFDIYSENGSSTKLMIRNMTGAGSFTTYNATPPAAFVQVIGTAQNASNPTPIQYVDFRANTGIFDLDSLKVTSGDNNFSSYNFNVEPLDSSYMPTGQIKTVSNVATYVFSTLDLSGDSNFDGIYGFRITVSQGCQICVDDIAVTNPRMPVPPNISPTLNPFMPILPAITEDDTANNGQIINSFIGTSINDADTGAQKGIAIISMDNQNGAWEYSSDGVSWNPISSVNLTNALLLREEDKVRFVPDGKNGTILPAKLTYKAWDQTVGTTGTRFDASTSGGSSAFSINFDIVTVNVASINDAPVITPPGNNFTQISEVDTNNVGNTVADIIGTSITDVDTSATKGIAIIHATNGNGSWQYSTDNGSNWFDVGVVDDESNSLLLGNTDKVRFVPNGIKGTTASIFYRAWDKTSGNAGDKVSTISNGGTSAFSFDFSKSNITVSDVNYAPTLTSVATLNGLDKTNTITYADLVAAADEADSDGDTVSFRIEGVNTGNLLKNGLPVATGVTTIGPGESLSWTVANNTSGLINAFTVKVFDGTATSSTAVQVKVNVQDTTPPVIPGANCPNDGTYLVGNTLNFGVFSNEVLFVTEGATGKPYLEILLGKGTANARTVRAEYVSGSGTNTLNFAYTIVSGDSSGQYETELNPMIQLNNCTIMDTSGNNVVSSFSNYDLSRVIVDTFAPVWRTGYPKVDTITSNSIKVVMQSIDETGTAYYVCLPNNSGEPSVAQVKAGQDATGSPLVSSLSGSSPVNITSDTFFTVSSLAVAADYDIYVVVEDAFGNIVTTNKRIDAKTKTIPIADFSISSKTANTASLTWTSAIGTSGIVVEQALVGTVNWIPAVTGPLALNASTAKVIGLAANTAYKFRLIVTGGVNEGISNVVTVSTDELPLVISVAGPSNSTYKVGDILDFKVTYDKNVTILGGTPSLKLAIGSNAREATYKSGSGSSVLSFRYTIQAGDLDTNGITFASSNISLNGATIRSTANEDANLSLNGVVNLSGVLVDGVSPMVTSLSLPINTTYKTADAIYVTANFDESVFILPGPTGVPYIELTIGTKKVKAQYYSGSGSQTIKFAYTVASGEVDSDGIDIATIINPNTGSIKDNIGNEAVYAYTNVNSSGLFVDAVAPTLTNSVISSDKKTIILSFSKNLVSAVADFGSVVNLSTDGGLIYKPVSSLANINGLDINGKDIVITFDTPLTGSKNKVAIGANSIKDVLGNLQTNVIETGNLGLAKPIAVKVPTVGVYKAGSQLNFTVVFDENVIVDTSLGTPTLQLTVGSTSREAVYFSGNGSNEITFAYTVEAGDNDNDGIKIASTAIELNGGTIKNSSNDNADLILNNIQDSSVVKIDTKSPTITSLTLPLNKTYKVGEAIQIIVNFDELILQMAPTTITIKVGDKSIAVPCITPPPGPVNAMVFIYNVTAGDIDEDGISLGNIIYYIGTVKDMAGNDAILSYSSVDTSRILVDAVAPKFVGVELNPDKKIVTLSFDEDIVDVTGSLLEDSVYLSTNGGTTYSQFSSLANKGSISINGKDLIVDFITPLDGSKNKIKVVENSIKDVFQNIKTDVTETSNLGTTISIAMDEPFTEQNLNGRVLTISIDGETFKDASLDKANFIINNAPKGVTVKAVTYTDSTHGLITLSYDGSDMDSFITNVGVTVLGSELTKGKDIKTNGIVIKVMDDPEAISIKNLSPIKEREEDKQVITVNITGGQFNDGLNKDNWTVTNLPAGVTVGSVTKVNANTAEIVLVGNSTDDYDSDINNVTVSCGTSEYNDSTGGSSLIADTGVTFTAKTIGVVTTNSIASIGKTSATLSGDVISSGDGTIKEKGFIYRISTEATGAKKVVSNENTLGQFIASLTGLKANTTYYVKAYVENEEGISYGSEMSFTTMPYSTNAKLKNLESSSGTLTPKFDTDTKNYTAVVDYTVDSIIITPTLAEEKVVMPSTMSFASILKDTNIATATIKVNGVLVNSGQPSQSISLKEGDNTITTIVTAEDGVTTETYTLVVTKKPAPTVVKGKVVDSDGKVVDTIEVKVTTELDGTLTAGLKAKEILFINTASGNNSVLEDLLKLSIDTNSDSKGSILQDGTVKFSSLEKGKNYEYKVICSIGKFKMELGIIRIKVDNNGNVELTSTLIDPYGVITDAKSGKVIDGVNVVVFYADTQRNKDAGIVPNTEVSLPIISGFAPNDNKNPQISDSFGSYAFMVYPNTDYYIVATKDGYEKYTSPIISVEKEIVKWDFKMNPLENNTTVVTNPDTSMPATGSAIDKKVLVEVGIVLILVGIVSVFTSVRISRKKKSNNK